MPEKFDIIVIGSGEGGKYVAWTLAKEGKRVALVERRYVGGSCPNIACLPSKNVIHSAKVASYFRRAPEFGLPQADFQVDMKAVRARKREMVDGLVAIHEKNFIASGTELIMGTARLTGPKSMTVALNEGGSRELEAAKIVLSVGTRAAVPDIPGLREAQPLTHVEALELDVVPDHLVILGGGYIGLEFAQAMRRFGARVTVIDRNARPAHQEDDDVSEALAQLLKDEGIEYRGNSQIAGIQGRSGESLQIDLGTEVLHASHILAAAGRLPNTENLGHAEAGIELDARGFIKVNEFLETSVEGVFAVGDCNGGPQFTHIAFDDFRVVRDHLHGNPRSTKGRYVPYCLFTDPELAHIGLTEKQARAQNIPYRLFKMPMAADLRTRTLSETRGFMKALVEAEGDKILGFTILGVDGGEIMSAVQIAMIGGMPYTALRDAVITHPTLMEGLVGLFSSTPTRS